MQLVHFQQSTMEPTASQRLIMPAGGLSFSLLLKVEKCHGRLEELFRSVGGWSTPRKAENCPQGLRTPWTVVYAGSFFLLMVETPTARAAKICPYASMGRRSR